MAALKKADKRPDLDYEKVSKLYMSIGKIFKKIGFDYKVIETTLYDGRERTILIVNHYGTERPRHLAICKCVQTYKEDFFKKQCLFDASEFIEAGASHVIVTSYVFSDGKINYDNLDKLVNAVGKDRIVLDLSCRRKGDKFYIVTDRWQKFSDEVVTVDLFEKLEKYCDEFLVHGVDVEGKGSGMDEELVWILANYRGNKITYAGGVSTLEEVGKFKRMSAGALDITIGSALDIFGGDLPYKSLVKM